MNEKKNLECSSTPTTNFRRSIEAFEKAAGLAGEALPDGLRLLAKALHNAVSSSRRFIPPERRRKLHAWIKASTVQAVRLCNAAFLAFKPASGAEEDEVDYSGISQLFQDPAQYSNHFSNLRAEILRIAIINHLRMRALAGLDVHQGHGHDFDGVLHEHRD